MDISMQFHMNSNNDGKPDIAEIDEDYDGKTDFLNLMFSMILGSLKHIFPKPPTIMQSGE